jgi:hypothetical protein
MKERDIYKDYKATTIIFSKPLYYGGRNFLKYNGTTKKYHIGNTASTAYSTSAPVTINAVTTRQLRETARQLEHIGYKEYTEKWNGKVDAYEGIKRAGL